jgi:DNA polymerase (family X)
MPVHNAEIAAIFEQTAELLEIKGEDQSRIRAYRRAARTVEALPLSIATLLDRGVDPATIPGIGKDFARDLTSIVKTARFELLDTLRRQLPGELGAMAAIPGLGPKRVKLLLETLKVRSLDDLRHAAQEGRLRDIRGLGLAVEKRVLALLSKPQEVKRFGLAEVQDEIDALLMGLRDGIADAQVAIAGSVRRRKPLIGDIDLLAIGSNAAAMCERLAGGDDVAEIRVHGPARTCVVLRSGPQVDLRVVAEECHGAALLYFTGSKRHNVALRGLAGIRGWKLNEYGLFAGKRKIAGELEDDIYAKLGLQFVPPELREDRGEIVEARENGLPALLTADQIRGDLHVRFDWHDAAADSTGYVEAAKSLGYGYVGLVANARRLMRPQPDLERLRARLKEAGRRAETSGIRILKGIESEVRPDGSLDLPGDIAALFDFVVARAEAPPNTSATGQTERLVRAINAPKVGVLALSTVPGQRVDSGFDPETVIAAAARARCLVSLGTDPVTGDLDGAQVRAVQACGASVSVVADADRPAAMARMRFAVDIARRGRLSAASVVNTQPADIVKELLTR